MNFCTYFDSNYFAKGSVCHYTLNQQNKSINLFIVCLDDKVFDAVKTWKNVTPIKLSDIEDFDLNFKKCKENRLQKEYYATMSPILPLYIFEKFGIDTLFYTDADMAFWSNPEELINIMGDKSLMVVDHGFEPPRSGVRFNVGILGYKNDEFCKSFLYWWREKCIEWCKWETLPDGRCADQGYLNILHENHNIYNSLSCPHPGVNLAPWSIGKHFVNENNGRKIVDGQYSLICYHYHEFKMTGLNSYYPTGWKLSNSDLKIIYEPYFKLIKQFS